MKQRRHDGGVTLIEMLVVLVMLSILAGAAALTLGSSTSEKNAELAALKLEADLRRAVRFTLDHQLGFALRFGEAGYSFLIADGEGWEPHPDPVLRDVKPFSDNLRISMQDHQDEVFAVSRYLEPKASKLWQVELGQDARAHIVTFDGVTVRTGRTGGD